MLFAYILIYFPFSTYRDVRTPTGEFRCSGHLRTCLGHIGLCATLILICQWARLAVVRTPPIDPTARGSSNYGGRGDPELWGTEAPFVQPTARGTTDDTDYNLCGLTLRGAETLTSVIR